ncbi:hypothetical protein [Peterkaempfera griseoplana]|uniref:hypothetical protein n=1 Tax=Peterkaempfera griseoplana TaxID=66896 RepID=UPI0006E4396D|nr:hypothetical protein [Peterkaempfera griseoplana]
MPSGRYSLHDPHDDTPLGEEHFSCAPGPAGWRYTSQVFTADGSPSGSVDLTLDSLGRPLRLQLRSGEWQVRGGMLDGLTWVRTDAGDPDSAHATEGHDRAHAFTGRSPAFLVATARLLRLQPGDRTRLRLVALTDPVLAPRTLDQGWSLDGIETHATDSGPLRVERYTVADLQTGEQHQVHLAGDVVLAAPGVELEALDGPPNQQRLSGPEA